MPIWPGVSGIGHPGGVEDRYEPESIEVDPQGGVAIRFRDATEASFDLMSLRLGCPCATCRSLRDRGEDVWPRPASPVPLRIEDARLHGAWGLVLVWNDGHDTGIYPFDALRRWHEGGEAFGPDSGLGGTGA
ncbi:MAG: DUF971 domain-containing protein [Acidimicrobiia bacterium]|nr:DUF971 domain-containing protein [Acidimicrobiia bacterium]